MAAQCGRSTTSEEAKNAEKEIILDDRSALREDNVSAMPSTERELGKRNRAVEVFTTTTSQTPEDDVSSESTEDTIDDAAMPDKVRRENEGDPDASSRPAKKSKLAFVTDCVESAENTEESSNVNVRGTSSRSKQPAKALGNVDDPDTLNPMPAESPSPREKRGKKSRKTVEEPQPKNAQPEESKRDAKSPSREDVSAKRGTKRKLASEVKIRDHAVAPRPATNDDRATSAQSINVCPSHKKRKKTIDEKVERSELLEKKSTPEASTPEIEIGSEPKHVTRGHVPQNAEATKSVRAKTVKQKNAVGGNTRSIPEKDSNSDTVLAAASSSAARGGYKRKFEENAATKDAPAKKAVVNQEPLRKKRQPPSKRAPRSSSTGKSVASSRSSSTSKESKPKEFRGEFYRRGNYWNKIQRRPTKQKSEDAVSDTQAPLPNVPSNRSSADAPRTVANNRQNSTKVAPPEAPQSNETAELCNDEPRVFSSSSKRPRTDSSVDDMRLECDSDDGGADAKHGSDILPKRSKPEPRVAESLSMDDEHVHEGKHSEAENSAIDDRVFDVGHVIICQGAALGNYGLGELKVGLLLIWFLQCLLIGKTKVNFWICRFSKKVLFTI